VKKQTPSLHTEENISSVNSEKKSWHAPKMTELNVQDTKGGCWNVGCEGPWNFIFGDHPVS
jgi:hypothetical protein